VADLVRPTAENRRVFDLLATAAQDDKGGSDLLAAIIGGAIGVVITALARALGVPSDARTHDAAIADRDDALATWVADRNYVLARDSKAIRNPKQATTESARSAELHQMDLEIADLRTAALHEYRDEERRARLARSTILASEGWGHRLWRRLASSAAPELDTPENATPVLDSWRKQSSMSAQDRPVWPDDATKRTLQDAIRSVRALGP
jgi:hypothetical protein